MSASRAAESIAAMLRRHLLRDLAVELDVLLERGLDAAHQRLELDARLGALLDRLDTHQEAGLGRLEAADARAALALDQHLHGAVGQPHELDDRADGSELEDVRRVGIVGLRVALCGQHERAAARHRLVERAHRLLAPDEKRHDHVREDDDVAQRQQRQDVGVERARGLACSSSLKNPIAGPPRATPARALRRSGRGRRLSSGRHRCG